MKLSVAGLFTSPPMNTCPPNVAHDDRDLRILQLLRVGLGEVGRELVRPEPCSLDVADQVERDLAVAAHRDLVEVQLGGLVEAHVEGVAHPDLVGPLLDPQRRHRRVSPPRWRLERAPAAQCCGSQDDAGDGRKAAPMDTSGRAGLAKPLSPDVDVRVDAHILQLSRALTKATPVPSNSPTNTTEVLPWRCRFVRRCKASLASGRTAISSRPSHPSDARRLSNGARESRAGATWTRRERRPSVLRFALSSQWGELSRGVCGRETSRGPSGSGRRAAASVGSRADCPAVRSRNGDALRKAGAGRTVRRVSAVTDRVSWCAPARVSRRHGPCLAA